MAQQQSRVMHGESRTSLYKLWTNVKDRCTNAKNPHFHNYGGRGIKLHPALANDFAAFKAAVGPRPSPGHTLDRRNNDGDYEPGNLTWATKKEQARNQRKNRLMTLNGRTQSMAAWAEELGLMPSTLHYRVHQGGMTEEEALTTPRRHGRKPAARVGMESRQ